MGMGTYLSAGVYSREIDLSEIIPAVSTSSAAIVGGSKKGTLAVALISNTQQFINEYGKPELGNYFHYSALAYLAKGTVLYCKRVINGALYGGIRVTQSGSTANSALTTGVTSPVFVADTNVIFNVYGKDPGAWNSTISVGIENVDINDYTFDIAVYSTDTNGVTAEVERWTVSRKTQVDGYGSQMYLEDRINGFSKYIVVDDGGIAMDTVLPTDTVTTGALALGGGTDGTAVTDSDISTGWDDFNNPDNIDVRILINAGYTSTTVQNKMKTIAESRKDCLAVLDIPSSALASVSAMTTWRTTTQNFNSSYTCVYTGWLKINDQYNDKVVSVPPSGFVAAQMAYSDSVADAWFAPAGFSRGLLNILGVSNVFTQGERDSLYKVGLNPIQMFRGEGIVIWGQKTQQTKASALDRINVRRMLIVLEKALGIALRTFVFEPNSTLTRFRITSTITEFMNKIPMSCMSMCSLSRRGLLNSSS
jgi:phage tail sheath protein FI